MCIIYYIAPGRGTITKPADKPKSKPKNGRPSKYNAQFHPILAEYLARAGMIEPDICEKLNIAHSTLSLWKKEHPEFSEALKNGKESIDDGVVRSLLTSAMGYERENEVYSKREGQMITVKEYYPPNTTAQIFWLKNRRPNEWRDRQEHTGIDGRPMEFQIIPRNTKVDEDVKADCN